MKGYGATEGEKAQCRTCKGTGKITKQDKEGIALIPYGDTRLAPSRTNFYVFTAVISFLVVTSLFIFFFYPRTIKATSFKMSIVTGHVGQNSSLIYIKDIIQLTNDNFFSVYLHSIDIIITFNSIQVGKLSEVSKHQMVSISRRSTMNKEYIVRTDYTTNSVDVFSACCKPIKNDLSFNVQVNTKFSYFKTDVQYSDNMYQLTSCSHLNCENIRGKVWLEKPKAVKNNRSYN